MFSGISAWRENKRLEQQVKNEMALDSAEQSFAEAKEMANKNVDKYTEMAADALDRGRPDDAAFAKSCLDRSLASQQMSDKFVLVLSAARFAVQQAEFFDKFQTSMTTANDYLSQVSRRLNITGLKLSIKKGVINAAVLEKQMGRMMADVMKSPSTTRGGFVNSENDLDALINAKRKTNQAEKIAPLNQHLEQRAKIDELLSKVKSK